MQTQFSCSNICHSDDTGDDDDDDDNDDNNNNNNHGLYGSTSCYISHWP